MRKFLKLGLLSIISISFVNATILTSLLDGWDENRDVFASSTDRIIFTNGSLVTHRFTFDTTSFDALCLAVDVGFQRSANYLINGVKSDLVNMYAYDEYMDGATKLTIQERGGSRLSCSFFFWENRNESCDGIFLATGNAADYTPYGCTPDVADSIAEGSTSTYIVGSSFYQITCADAIYNNYVKCQADDISILNDCMADSDADIIDDDRSLFETCEDNINSGIDTSYACDLSHTLDWGISWGNDAFYDTVASNTWIQGIPNATFRLYSYRNCGTGIQERQLVGLYGLTQLMNKKVVCDGNYAFNASGEVWGFMPWYGIDGYFNNTYVYGSSSCVDNSGFVCTEEKSYSAIFDLNSTACIVNSGSCYDGIMNRDEISEDYGGICGMCDNSSLLDDLYYDVARQSYPNGYFDTNKFDNSSFCPEAEDSVDIAVLFSTFIAVITILFFGLIMLFLSLYLFSTFGAVIRFFRRKKEKNLSKLNNKKGV